MTNTINTIKTALESLDKMKLSCMKEFKSIQKIEIKLTNNDIDVNTIKIYHDNNVIYNGIFELAGVMHSELQVWTWAWTIPGINKLLIYKTKNLLDYGLNKIDDHNNDILLQIKQFLINGNIHINNVIKKDILLAMISYLIKANMILEINISPEDYDKFRATLISKKTQVKMNVSDERVYYTLFITI